MGVMISNLILTITAGIAYYIYWQSNQTEKSNAAAVLVSDVERAQKIISEIRVAQSWVPEQRIILHENNWNKYRHLVVRDFSKEDRDSFNQFFDACTDIDASKLHLDKIYFRNTEAKIDIVQAIALQVRATDTSQQIVDRQTLLNLLGNLGYTFTLNYPQTRITATSNSINFISDTAAFKKLKELAQII